MTLITHSEKIDRLTVTTDDFGRRFAPCAWCGKLVLLELTEQLGLLGVLCDYKCRLESIEHYN